jgi:plastocyanin
VLLSKNEIFAWVVAAIGIAVMGVIAFHGPFHDVVKAQSTSYAPLVIKIEDDPNTVGKYVPATATVHVGQTVTWTNVSGVDHTATERSDAFDSKNIATGGATYSWVAKGPATYHYVCSYHPKMLGTLVVVK